MIKRKYIFIIPIIIASLVLASYLYFYLEEKYQKKADVLRLNHIVTIGSYLEEYKSKVGKYPLEGGLDESTYVFIATDKQKGQFEDIIFDSADEKEVEQLILELEKGLGRDIEMPYDPQKFTAGRANFYLYVVYKDGYNLSVQLYDEYQFADKISKHNNILEISNSPDEGQKIWTLEELKRNKEFQKAAKTEGKGALPDSKPADDSVNQEEPEEEAINEIIVDAKKKLLLINGDKLYYANKVGKDIANRLGKYLESRGMFVENDMTISTMIDKRGTIYVFSIVVNEEFIDSKELEDDALLMSQELYSNVFEFGNRVEVHLCDSEFNVLKVVNKVN